MTKHKLTKSEIDALVRNKNEYLASNPEHTDIIVEDLIKYQENLKKI